MLIARSVEWIIYERDLALCDTHAPDGLARVSINFCELAGAAARKKNIAIRIDVDGIHVRKIETAAANIDKPLLAVNIDIVPRSPLQNEITIGCELLNDLLSNRGGRISSSYVTAHVDVLGAQRDHEIGSVLQHLQLVLVHAVTIRGRVNFNLLIVGVQPVEMIFAVAREHGQHPIALDLHFAAL